MVGTGSIKCYVERYFRVIFFMGQVSFLSFVLVMCAVLPSDFLISEISVLLSIYP